MTELRPLHVAAPQTRIQRWRRLLGCLDVARERLCYEKLRDQFVLSEQKIEQVQNANFLLSLPVKLFVIAICRRRRKWAG